MNFDFASGEVLLGIDSVCGRLSISRSTFERLRRSSSVGPADANDEFAGAPVFPEPTLVIGRSPRWSAKTLNAWLVTAASSSKSLGAQFQAFANRSRTPL